MALTVQHQAFIVSYITNQENITATSKDTGLHPQACRRMLKRPDIKTAVEAERKRYSDAIDFAAKMRIAKGLKQQENMMVVLMDRHEALCVLSDIARNGDDVDRIRAVDRLAEMNGWYPDKNAAPPPPDWSALRSFDRASRDEKIKLINEYGSAASEQVIEVEAESAPS